MAKVKARAEKDNSASQKEKGGQYEPNSKFISMAVGAPAWSSPSV